MTCLTAMLTWLLATIGAVDLPQGTSTAELGALMECSCTIDDEADAPSGNSTTERPPPARASGGDGTSIYNGF